MFYKTLIASFALHLAVFSGVALVGTGGSSGPRADEVLSVDLKEASVQKGIAEPVRRPPAFAKRPEAASIEKDEIPKEESINPIAPAIEAAGNESEKADAVISPIPGTNGEVEMAYNARGASSDERAGSACKTDMADALSKIREAIERAKSYPLIARKRGLEGTVLMGFQISESGTPTDIRVVKSSGYRVLDGEAVRIVKKAAPYPLLGSEIVEVPISFRLRR